jgi:hypothetical protein
VLGVEEVAVELVPKYIYVPIKDFFLELVLFFYKTY